MVCYLTSKWAFRVTQVAVQSIQMFTNQPHEIWLIDNGSRKSLLNKLQKIPGINLIINNTDPVHILKNSPKAISQLEIGSMANGVGLELVTRIIHPESPYLFVMHNDILAVQDGWLKYLLSKLTNKTRGAAVVSDPSRVRAMHVSGLLIDFQLYRQLGMTFWPNLPEYDVGDDISLKLRENNYDYFVCKNTFLNPDLEAQIPPDIPLLNLYSDRAFDDQGHVIFMHMGRGTQKSAGLYNKPGKTYPKEWVRLAMNYLKDAQRS